ncbi:squalene/phytoene synthase family protein [Streptomyces sp. NPDC088097]|uniref:squalene/phytoene synthase family protein n=1 Tax=Streptomyces sp. NPDC088097 TaxID=3365823 RepID=UPI003818CCFE
MPSWRTTLTRAGISDPGLREAHTDTARRVLRREPAPYVTLRLLADPALVPWLTAGLAFMNLVDDTAETGTPEQRAAGLAALGDRVRGALDSKDGPDPLLRAYAHAVRTRELPAHWITRFLEGAATAEAGFDGFADEAGFQAYLDAYAWPGVVAFNGLQYQGGPDEEQAAAWRRFVDAAQRVDFLADLCGDLADGRLCLPRAHLAAHGVTRTDLEQGRDTPAVRDLLAAECARARTALAAAEDVPDLTAPGLRPVVAAMTELMAHQLTAVERAGAGALRKDVGYGLAAPLRTLLRARAQRPRRR